MWRADHLAVTIVAIKAVVAGGVARLLGFPLRTALLAGLALAQVGEFSLVLLRLRREQVL